MPKLDNLQIWISPLTNKIYAGYTNGDVATSKVDITQKAIDAVGTHMFKTGFTFKSEYGHLVFVPEEESADMETKAGEADIK